MSNNELSDLLEYLHDKYNNLDFIENDPISIPHTFSRKEDIEVSGLLTATIAWGNRKIIVKNAHLMMQFMDNAPFDFVTTASSNELAHLSIYVHRTFNGQDLIDFILALRHMYTSFGTLGNFFELTYSKTKDMRIVLSIFRSEFFKTEHCIHCEKHLSSIDNGAACKRLNMYLRWMVRHDKQGVDFGLWKDIPMSALYLPLDVHSSKVGRQLELLTRKQNDWKSVEEITQNLRSFDAADPVRFDYALFGAGIETNDNVL